MRKSIFLTVALAALMLGACGEKKQETDEARNTADMTKAQLEQALADQDSLIVLMTDIQGGLDQIKALENILSTPGGETANSREQIKADIFAIQQSVIERQKRLADFEQRLNASNSNNAKLQNAIAALKAQIDEQVEQINTLRGDLEKANIVIGELNQQVDTLNTKLTSTSEQLVTTTEEKDKALEQNEKLTNDLNRCYYVIGSKKELKEHKIIESGFLRKTKILPADFEMQYFTAGDMRTLTTLPLHSRKAKIMTNQPESSYTITETASGGKVINITDPARFWGANKILVVQID